MKQKLDLEKNVKGNLGQLVLKNEDIGEVEIKEIIHFLLKNEEVKTLELIDCSFNVYAMKLFSTYLRKLTKLVELNLYRIVVLEEPEVSFFEKKIAQALEKNNTLKHIHLNGIINSDQGAFYLAEALKVNNTLRNLEFKVHKQISDKGYSYLAEALKMNNGLIQLTFEYNNISNQGAIYFSEALKVNNHLEFLRLHESFITKEIDIFFQEALKLNYKLIGLTLSNLDGIFCSKETYDLTEENKLAAFKARNEAQILLNLESFKNYNPIELTLKEKKLLQLKLAEKLPAKILNTTSEQLKVFNASEDNSFINYKNKLSEICDNEELINAIFSDYKKYVDFFVHTIKLFFSYFPEFKEKCELLFPNYNEEKDQFQFTIKQYDSLYLKPRYVIDEILYCLNNLKFDSSDVRLAQFNEMNNINKLDPTLFSGYNKFITPITLVAPEEKNNDAIEQNEIIVQYDPNLELNEETQHINLFGQNEKDI